MQKWILGLLMSVVMVANAFAVGRGLYLGIQAGPSNNSASNQQAQVLGPPTTPPTTTTVTPKSQQFGSRIFMGYMVNPYAGFEWGATYFSGIQYDSKGATLCGSANARVRDLEVMGKGVVPVKQFNVFGKVGAAASYQTNGGALNPSTTDECGKSTYISKVVPVFSIGAGYDLSQNWVAELALHSVQAGGKIGSMTMYGLALSYHFVDEYCGQFLC
jgi:hypothetical protein